MASTSDHRDDVTITSAPLVIGALGSTVVCETAGAVATFTGTTRDTFEGKRVLRLEVMFSIRAPQALAVFRHVTYVFCA